MSGRPELSSAFSGFTLDDSSSKLDRKLVRSTWTASKFQEEKRREALSRQASARLDRTWQARQLAGRTDEQTLQTPGHDGHSGDRDGQANAEESTSFFAKQLMQPEWMIEVPEDMHQDWYVMPRPEGPRCLVIASWGSTISRLRNGRVFHRFDSWLPGGSRSTLAGSDPFCILDCIFDDNAGTYYVLDLMCWKGYALYDCAVEFRLFWRDTKFAEERESARRFSGGGGECRYHFEPVPVYKSDADGLKAAHSAAMPFTRDGCYFLHKDGHYETEGPTPLALLWKDADCSRYFIDTDAGGQTSPNQHVILQYTEDGQVCTGDEPPIPLSTLPASVISPRPGRLLRFTLKEGGIEFSDGKPVAADLHYEGLANQRRGRADFCSKVRQPRNFPLSSNSWDWQEPMGCYCLLYERMNISVRKLTGDLVICLNPYQICQRQAIWGLCGCKGCCFQNVNKLIADSRQPNFRVDGGAVCQLLREDLVQIIFQHLARTAPLKLSHFA